MTLIKGVGKAQDGAALVGDDLLVLRQALVMRVLLAGVVAVVVVADAGDDFLFCIRDAEDVRAHDDLPGVQRVVAQVDELARLMQQCAHAQQQAVARREAVHAAQPVEELRRVLVDAADVRQVAVVAHGRAAREVEQQVGLLGDGARADALCATPGSVAVEEGRVHDEDRVDVERAHDFLVEQQCRQQQLGAALADLEDLHELMRRQRHQRFSDLQELLWRDDGRIAGLAFFQMRGEDARLEAREHECVDVRMLDAGPERGERGVQVIAHGRWEHDVDALFFGEVLEDAEAAAGDVRLEEQRAVLPAREAEAARCDVEQQRRLRADLLILFEEVVQREELVVDFLRHVGDVEAEARAHVEEVEDAEAVLRLAHDGRGNRVDLGDAVV